MGSAAAITNHSITREFPSCSRSRACTAITTGPATIPTASTINGMGRIADYLERIALDVARRPARPAFVKLVEPANPHAAGGDIGAARHVGIAGRHA